MQKATIEYCVDGFHTIVIPINSMEDMEKKLQEIKVSEAVAPYKAIFTVDIVIEGIGVITVGLDERTYLCYQSVDYGSLASLGDETAEGYTEYYAGDYTPMSNKYIIPYSDALKALEVWINTGELSDAIKWTDAIYVIK